MRRSTSTPAAFAWPAHTAVLLAGVLLALNPGRAAAQAAGYAGVVVDDRVEIRAGAGTSFYVVGEATRDQQVQVIEVVEGYVKIVPPSGVYSMISKAFVDAKGDGKSGVVNSDATDAKTNAVYAAPAGNEKAYRRQVNLKKGDKVEIVGEDGSNYKIVPPKGAYVFLPPASVRREKAGATPVPSKPAPATDAVKPAEPAPAVETPQPTPTPEPEAVESPAATTRPAPQATPTAGTETQTPTNLVPTATDGAKPEPEPAPAPVKIEPIKPKPLEPQAAGLAAAEARLAEAGKQPVKDQPITELLATYRGLSKDASLSPSDHRIINYRITQLERHLTLQNSLKELEAAHQEGTTQIKIEEPKPKEPGVFNPADYDAVGQLLASGVYDGQAGPRLYRLVEPAGMRTIAYVRAGRKLDPAQTLGKIVGIKGTQRYDPAIKLRVITVDRVDVLEAGGTATHEATPAETAATPATQPAAEPVPKGDGVYTEVKPATNPADEPMK